MFYTADEEENETLSDKTPLPPTNEILLNRIEKKLLSTRAPEN